jgi:exodeoxyribonuclease I
MNELSFFWHDYETFGKIPRRDRPAQFAGVRTDAALNEIAEPVMLYCQPAPDSLPDPEACLLTGITPQVCLERGVPEYAFAQAIEAQLSQSGTVGVGYNSIRFDDEVTRYLFWRNLIDPYAREWQNQCGRWDLLDVVRLTWALRPQGIEWPKHEDGRPSFKLEHLTKANGLSHEAAHDALSDVRATVALARLIKNKNPKLWDFCLRMRRKDEVALEMGVGKPFLHVSGMYGTDKGCMAIVFPLGSHPSNKNEVIVWDLSSDPAELFSLSTEQIRLRMFSKSEDLPEGVTRLPVKTLHINKSPMVIGNLKMLTADIAEKWGIDVQKCMNRSQTLAKGANKLTPLWPEVFARSPLQSTDVDEDLYGGFVGNDDRRTLQGLKLLTSSALSQRLPSFTDARLEELFFRYRARNFPESLNEHDEARWLEHRVMKLHQGASGMPTIQAFLEQLDVLNETADARGQAILSALYDYAQSIAPAH